MSEFLFNCTEQWVWVAYRTSWFVIRVYNPKLQRCHVCNVCHMTWPECSHSQTICISHTHPWYMILILHRSVMCLYKHCARLVWRRWKVTVDFRDGWRTYGEEIRNVEKHLYKFWFSFFHDTFFSINVKIEFKK